MPTRPPQHRAPSKQSETERKRDVNARRGPKSWAPYDWTWRKLRKLHLSTNPFCVFHMEHKGEYVGAAQSQLVVDHIEPIASAPHRRLDPSNLRTLCKSCHDARTARDQAFGRGSTTRRL